MADRKRTSVTERNNASIGFRTDAHTSAEPDHNVKSSSGGAQAANARWAHGGPGQPSSGGRRVQ